MKKNVPLVHFIYITSILVLIIVLVLTGRLSDNQSVLDYFGFAGTLIGIILAAVALIYSFYQSTTYGSANEKLDVSAKKIESVTTSLDKTNEQFSMQLKETFSEINQDVQRAFGQVTEGLTQISISMKEQHDQNKNLLNSLDKVQESIHETRYSLISALNIGKGEKVNEIDNTEIKIFIKNYVMFQSLMQTLFLYYLVEIMKNERSGNMYSVVVWAIGHNVAINYDMFSDGDEKAQSTVFDNNIGAFWGIFYELTSGGLLDLDGNISNTKVKSMNEDLVEAVVNKIKQSEHMTPEILESFNKMVNDEER